MKNGSRLVFGLGRDGCVRALYVGPADKVAAVSVQLQETPNGVWRPVYLAPRNARLVAYALLRSSKTVMESAVKPKSKSRKVRR